MLKNILILILLAIITYFIFERAFFAQNTQEQIIETTPVTIFVQDKESARISDCSVTVPVTYQIPQTKKVLEILDASLKILFEEELAQYGRYKSVELIDTVARVTLVSSTTQSGAPLSSLSSCEIGHLTSVLTNTLTQYDEVDSVEIYSPEGRIEF